MNRVAVFGSAGAGKSTLSLNLAQITGLPLFIIDEMQFREGGVYVPQEEFLAAHAKLLGEDRWIVDGFGSMALSWERFARADTLIYIDLPVAIHYWWVTKRFLKGLFKEPAGWPKGSPLWSSTRSSYQAVASCHKHLTPKYRALAAEMASSKRVHHLKSAAEIAALLESVRREWEK